MSNEEYRKIRSKLDLEARIRRAFSVTPEHFARMAIAEDPAFTSPFAPTIKYTQERSIYDQPNGETIIIRISEALWGAKKLHIAVSPELYDEWLPSAFYAALQKDLLTRKVELNGLSNNETEEVIHNLELLLADSYILKYIYEIIGKDYPGIPINNYTISYNSNATF